MEDDEDLAEPFWLQTADGHRRLRRRRQLSSIFLNSGLLLTLLLLIACLLIFLIIPSFLSYTSQILRPHSVKKSWDSLNLVLVLFAIICGFLSRNGVQRSNNGSGSYEPAASAARTSVSSSYYEDHRRFQQSALAEKISRRLGDYERYQDRFNHSAGGGGMSRLRSINSYPDLRQESLWSGGGDAAGDDRWRFYDDTHIRDYSYRFPSSSADEILRHREVAKEEEMPVADVKESEKEKEIAVDTVTVVKEEVKEEEVMAAADPSDPPPPLLPPAPSSPPLPPPAKAAKRKVQRTYRSVGQSRSSDGREEREMDIEDFYKRPPPSSSRSPPQKAVSRRRVKRNVNRPEFVESIKEEEEEEKTVVEEVKYVYLPPPSPPPPPPPPPPEKKKKTSKDFLISLRRKKKKKQRQNSVDNLASLFDPESEFPPTQSESSIPPPSPLPPPPPPPPPPQHFLQNLFSPRRGKSKKVHSVSLAPPPPPPLPPRRRAADSTEVHLSRSVQRSMDHPSVSRAKSERAQVPAYVISNREEPGNASPLIPIPPPPPPPPFKMPAWRFEVRGDYVRVASFNSSRSGSPDLESEDPSDRESSPMAGGSPAATAGSPLFCPSPDVDTKADNFIARFRAGLTLEKVKSNLGPGVGEGPI
ncbi:unnamed protein product [Linum tenue]|uniref:Hydroxyproline-rich glycoprotein family protein n=1 Tax=Linum tenue TaxID=586396 RepID=A0AAV0KGS3_9ROSI|nr:unnamed protein product [Linum tenue]